MSIINRIFESPLLGENLQIHVFYCFLACFPRPFFQFCGRVKKAQGTAFFTVSLLSWAFHRLCEPKVKVVQPVSRGPGFSATDAKVSLASVVSMASRQRSFRISGKLLIFLGEDMFVNEIGTFESRLFILEFYKLASYWMPSTFRFVLFLFNYDKKYVYDKLPKTTKLHCRLQSLRNFGV